MDDHRWDPVEDTTRFDYFGVPIPGLGVTVGVPNSAMRMSFTPLQGQFVHSLHVYYEGFDSVCNWRIDTTFTDATTGVVYSNWFNVGPTNTTKCTSWAERNIEVNSGFPPGKFTITVYDKSQETKYKAYISHLG